MAKLSVDEVLKLARLARLSLTKEELHEFSEELSSILEYVEQLGSVDLDDYEPTVQVSKQNNIMRKDEVVNYQASPDSLLDNVPVKEGRFIKVKRIIT